MLVINERAALPRSEQRVLDWMRTWTGQYIIVGLAISGCHVPERHREGDTQEADLVVITPRAVVVIEVKGTVPDATSGVLSVQADGRWRLSGFEGDPIHVRDNDTSPFDQVTNNVFNLKTLVRGHHPDAYVDGLIVVVPSWESTITLEVESRQHGCGVVLGSTPGELRAWLHRTSNRKLLWTAEAVHALLVDMNIGDQLTVEDLLAEGFPSATGRRVQRSAAVSGESVADREESVTEVSGAAVAQAYPDHLSGQFARRTAAQDAEVGATPVTTAPADSPMVEYVSAVIDGARMPESPAHRLASSASTVDTALATPSAVQQRDSSQAAMSEQLVVVTDRADESGVRAPIEGVLNYVAPLAYAVSGHTDSPPPGSPAPYEADESGGVDHPPTGTEHGPSGSDPDTAPPVRPGASPYPDGLEDIPTDLEPRRLPESGGQRPPHSLSPRADHQLPWIAPDPDTDSSLVPRVPSTYVRPPWIPPDDDALASPPAVDVQRGHPEPDSDDVRALVLDKSPTPPAPVEPARSTGTSGEFRESAPEAEVDPSPTAHPASEFTDRWTSWIDDDRPAPLPRRTVPVRPEPNEPLPAYGNVARPSGPPPFAYRDVGPPTPERTVAEPSTRGPHVDASLPVRASRPVLADVSAPVDEPRFLRRNVTVVEPENRSTSPLHAAVTTIRDHVPTRMPSLKLGDRLPQQLAALAVIALSVGAIWVIVSTGAAEEGASVTPPAQQNQNAEVVGPPGAETPGRSPISLPAVCFPLPTSC